MQHSSEQIRASADRATRQASEDLDQAAFDARGELAMKHQQGSSRQVILADITVYEAFKPICNAAARRILELNGSASDLQSVLSGKLRTARAAYERVAYQSAAFGSNDFARDHWNKVSAKLQSLVEDVIADFEMGLVAGATPVQPTIIVNSQGGQAIVNTGNGNSQTLHGSITTQTLGVDFDALVNALQQLDRAIETAPMDGTMKQEGRDYVIDMTREAKEPAPDVSRLRRYGAKVSDWSSRASAGAAGGLIAQGVVAALTALGMA